MDAATVAVYLVFHAPFIVIYAVIASKYRRVKSTRYVLTAFIASYVAALGEALFVGADDVYGWHLLALGVATPWVLWYYLVRVERSARPLLTSVLVLSWGYALEAAFFAVAVFAAFQVVPLEWR